MEAVKQLLQKKRQSAAGGAAKTDKPRKRAPTEGPSDKGRDEEEERAAREEKEKGEKKRRKRRESPSRAEGISQATAQGATTGEQEHDLPTAEEIGLIKEAETTVAAEEESEAEKGKAAETEEAKAFNEHRGRANMYAFEWEGRRILLHPLWDGERETKEEGRTLIVVEDTRVGGTPLFSSRPQRGWVGSRAGGPGGGATSDGGATTRTGDDGGLRQCR